MVTALPILDTSRSCHCGMSRQMRTPVLAGSCISGQAANRLICERTNNFFMGIKRPASASASPSRIRNRLSSSDNGASSEWVLISLAHVLVSDGRVSGHQSVLGSARRSSCPISSTRCGSDPSNAAGLRPSSKACGHMNHSTFDHPFIRISL